MGRFCHSDYGGFLIGKETLSWSGRIFNGGRDFFIALLTLPSEDFMHNPRQDTIKFPGVTDNTCRSVQHSLQSVCLRRPGENRVAVVDTGRHETRAALDRHKTQPLTSGGLWTRLTAWGCHCQRARPSSRCHDLVGP